MIEKTSYKWPDGTKARLQAVALEGESPEQTWLRALAYLEKPSQLGTEDTSSGTLATLISRVETLVAQRNSLPPPEIIIWQERNEDRLNNLEYGIRTVQDRLDALCATAPDTASPTCVPLTDGIASSTSDAQLIDPDLSTEQPDAISPSSENVKPESDPPVADEDISTEPKGRRYSKKTKKMAVKAFNQMKSLESIQKMILKAEGFAPTRRQMPTRLAQWRKELNG